MTIHDWTRVDAGVYHGFHAAWVTHLSEALNGGLLPAGYYAMPEHHGGPFIADVLTLHTPPPPPQPPTGDGGLTVTAAPPKTGRKLTVAAASRTMRRTLAIRHVSGHRIVALVEIVSPANKDRPAHVAELADKVEAALWAGIHVVLVDLVPAGPHDRSGMHGAIWERFDDEPYELPPAEPLALASYVGGPYIGGRVPVAYVEHLALGAPLPELPLFLDPDRYVNLPLEPTYLAAYGGMPAFWREVLERPPAPPIDAPVASPLA